MFDQDYKLLNDAQKRVVHLIDKNALILAPAGTGKTKIIAMRTAHLIKNKTLPEKILCLTFTNKAAKEMKDRVGLYLDGASAREVTIKTFHGFCYSVMHTEKQSSHFSFPCTIIDETDSDSILKKIILEKGYNDEHLYYPELRSFIENIKRYSLDFDLKSRYNYKKIIESYLKEEKAYRKSSKSFIMQHGLSLFRAYQHYLKDNNCVDFMDLIVEAKYLLEQDGIRKKWHDKYSYIQVDEMQDTSSREYDVIKLLSLGNNLALFGDFNQTIYEWRGSNPRSMIEDFKKDFSPEVAALSINYRATKLLLEAANDYIKNSRLYPIHCIPTSTEQGEKIQLIEARTKEEEFYLIARLIKERAEHKYSTVILTRTNEYAKNISEVFQKEQIPCTVIEDTKFFRKKEVKDLLAFFEYSINPRNGHALLKLCHHPYLEMEEWLLSSITHTKEMYMSLCDWFNAESRDPYTKLFTAYNKQCIVVLDVESTGLDTTRDDIIQIAAVRYGLSGSSDQLDILVKPTKSVGASYFVHGFSDEMLAKNGMEPRTALIKLLEFTENRVIVGHNISYDLQIIKSMLNRYELPAMKILAVYDTLDLACKVYPKMTNHKLETLADFLNTSIKPNHNAMQDILATSEILAHLIIQIQLKTQQRLEKLEAFYSYVRDYQCKTAAISQYILGHTIPESIVYMMTECDFKKYYSEDKLKSLRELYKIAAALYDDTLSVQDNILHLLAYAAMHYSEIEQSDLFKGRIPIITVHQAKGLEFDEVYIAGCNDKVFPLSRSIRDNQLEEEKRLFYVGMTRARKNLFLSYHLEAPKSILLDEIGKDYKAYKICGQNE